MSVRTDLLAIARAALMEAGGDPKLVILGDEDEVLLWTRQGELDWRSREVVATADGWQPICLKCWRDDGQSVNTCEATAPFTRDCGRAR